MVKVEKKKIIKEIIRFRYIYLMLIPAILIYAVFAYGPMFGNLIAFQDFKVTKGFFDSPWVGLKHFENFFRDRNFIRTVRNTVAISLWSLVFGFPAPIILALLLNEVKNMRFKKLVQTITYMPHFISVVTLSGLVLMFLSSDGLLNQIRMLFGADPIIFMNEPSYFRLIYTLSGIWSGIGWESIIYLSALSSVDQELYEAAAIDGAGRWKQTFHITIPGILPTIIIMFIMRVGNLLSVGQEKILLLYNPTIYETADVISTYVYRRGLIQADYSYGTAISMFNSLINILLLAITNYTSKKVSGEALW